MSQQKWIVAWAFLSLFVFALTASCLGLPPSSSQEIHWMESLDDAFQLAKTENKPLLLHFYGDHCPPCRMLDAKAFRDRELISTVNSNVIAVRINADKDRQIAQRYQVNRWPTDVYLLPNESELHRGVSNQDPVAYAKTIERMALRHRDWTLEQVALREAQQRREKQTANRGSATKTRISAESNERVQPVRVRSTTWSQNSEPSSVGNPYALQNDVPQNNALAAAATAAPSASQIPAIAVVQDSPPMPSMPSVEPASVATLPDGDPSELEPTQEARRSQQLVAVSAAPGLGGYCPVALQDSIRAVQLGQPAGPAWVAGRPEFAVRHRGRIYQCASEQARRRLLQAPDHFAPVLSGCDLVEFVRHGDLVDGNCEFGFIEQKSGRVFLFSTRANFEEFSRNCEAYSPNVDDRQERIATESHAPIRR